MESACSASPEACSAAAADAVSSGPSSLADLAAYAATAVSTVGLSAILLMQLDGISRLVLSPPRLLAKRRQEYRYAIEQCREYSSLMARQHVGGGRSAYDPKAESIAWENLTPDDGEEMDEVISRILDAKRPTPVIVAIEQDTTDERDPNAHHVFLAFPPDAGEEGGVGSVDTPGPPALYSRRVRAPLVAFCEKLAGAFEGQMTSTALCFVADASSGTGSEMIVRVVRRCDHGVATIPDPAWMTSLSLLIASKSHGITDKQFDRIIFALCRLDAWRVRGSVGASRTVLFTLPGQSCVPLILPVVQRVFVHERHVFVYDGCCYSVEAGIALRKRYGSSYRQQAANEVWEEVSASPRVVTATAAAAPLRHNRELPEKLAVLTGIQASVVEAWMASVDAFLEMKAGERKNFYTPFVCRMGFLMKRTGIGNGDGTDLSGLALKNLLQYVTGSRSRALPEKVMSEAIECMKETRAEFEEAVKGCEFLPREKIPMEQCVFTHKSILIGEKTLLDTVQPKEDWSLKAAKKLKSCLCCIPGEGDEEEDEEEGDEADKSTKPKKETDMSVPGAFATNTATRSKYVDGKAQFAFDPTAFGK